MEGQGITFMVEICTSHIKVAKLVYMIAIRQLYTEQNTLVVNKNVVQGLPKTLSIHAFS